MVRQFKSASLLLSTIFPPLHAPSLLTPLPPVSWGLKMSMMSPAYHCQPGPSHHHPARGNKGGGRGGVGPGAWNMGGALDAAAPAPPGGPGTRGVRPPGLRLTRKGVKTVNPFSFNSFNSVFQTSHASFKGARGPVRLSEGRPETRYSGQCGPRPLC